MNAVTSIEATQKIHYAEVRARLFNPSVANDRNRLVARIADLETALRQSNQERDEAQADVLTLLLDVSDLQGVVLSQAARVCELEGFSTENEIVLRVPAKQIIAEVLEDFPGITVSDILSQRRRRDLVKARHACMKAVHERRPDMSFPQIGRVFGRDHTSILHAVGHLNRPARALHAKEGQ